MNKAILLLLAVMYFSIIFISWVQMRLNTSQLNWAGTVVENLENQQEFNKAQLELNHQFIEFMATQNN